MTPTVASPCGRLVLYHGDNLAVLPHLAERSVDAVVCDPPYGIHGEDDEGRRRNLGVYSGNGPNPGWRELKCGDWDNEIPVEWVAHLPRVLRPGAAVMAWTDCLRPHVLQGAFEEHGLKFLRLLFWEKTNPPPNPNKNFVSGMECAVFARAPGKILAWHGGGNRRNSIACPKMAGHHKIHECEKPLGVMEWCLVPISSPGHVILDPFMGSGSTGAAALRMGRSFIGIEEDEKHFWNAAERLQAELAQGRLFDIERKAAQR